MSEAHQAPRSPRDEIDGIVYFPRLCDKVRLHAAGTLPPEYHANLGSGMDLWTCQFLGVDYAPASPTPKPSPGPVNTEPREPSRNSPGGPLS